MNTRWNELKGIMTLKEQVELKSVYTQVGEHDGLPLMRCLVRSFKNGPGAYALFYCQECDMWHRHGAVGVIGERGHRVAHCTNKKSKYNSTDYYIYWDAV